MFTWVCAGADYSSFGGLSLYYRYKRRQGGFEEKRTPRGFFVKLKDREIFLTGPGTKDFDVPNVFSDWDSCVDMDVLGEGTAVDHSALMFCYEHKESKKDFRYDPSKISVPIFGDSAGFKLAMGTLEFINPVSLAAWYNKFVTHAMTLDLPPYPNISSETLRRCANIQRLNTEALKRLMKPHITLYNIIHGLSYRDRLNYAEHVWDDSLVNWGIGSSYYGNTLDFLYSVLSSIEITKGKTFHVFGVAAVNIIPLLAWLGRYHEITSDSSSSVQSGLRSYFFTLQGYKMQKPGMGRITGEILQCDTEHPRIPCSCNICNAIGSTEIFYYGSPTLTSRIISMHNIGAMNKYSKIWNRLAQTCTLDQYKEKVSKMCANPQEANLWKLCLDFITMSEEYGTEKALKKYKSFMTIWMDRKQEKTLLVPPTNPTEERYERMIGLFERFHRDNHVTYKRTKKSGRLELQKSMGIRKLG